MIVADTNVISELMRTDPDPDVVTWLAAQTDRELRITSISLAEVLSGIERLPQGRRQRELREAAVEIFIRFERDVLPFDADAAAIYARIVADRDALGMPISGYDAQIAAICQARGASLATRNGKDFVGIGLDLIDPWGPTQA